ncbi:polysaccharide lyase family 8 super-sandwich domain-containing protein [Micromonospora sp. HM5-17]|uniref:polysaccharide lyase family 8 super-sandwich domain-containing protein n=1 Tax=Micromonospora sp. HM5-17 TaxID=2487710 RepID=UPI0018F2A606|nr:polysaccharide lyase family 8 super-sandwich domain-containing protein [Micromonospora sp. HM5-17]
MGVPVPVPRRTLLTTLPAAALVALTPPLRARAASPPDRASGGPARSDGTTLVDPATAHAAVRDNMVAVFAGTAEVNARPDVAGKLAAIETTARTRLAALDGAGPGELFQGVPLGTSDPNLTTSFQYLYEIALATRVPGGALAGDTAVRRRVIDGLAWLYDQYYGDQDRGYYGNWHNWEIGISWHVSRTLVLLHADLAAYRPDLTPTYVAAMDGYLRNGRDGDVDLDSRFHTGANLVDITTNRILQGAVLGDDARISKAVADQLTVFATIDPYQLRHGVTDGYYADGSFIQHASVAYTGSYGRNLLTRVVQTIKILQGTGYLTGDELVRVVQGWVANAFAPLIFEGWMMEIVKGRAVSRTTTGYTDVAAVVEAVVDLSGHAADADAAALRGYVKFVRENSRATLNPTSFVSPVSIARYADILADSTTPAADLNPPARHAAFNAMDRTVHHRPGYAFALARNSRRISKYEYMNGENLLPWFQGEGAHHLYLAGQDQTEAYGVDYYTVVSPYRLAGVTAPVEERRSVPELYGTPWYDNPERGFTSSSESQNTYVYFPRGSHDHSGGASLGAYGTAGFVQSDDVAYLAKRAGQLPDDFVAYRNATATKSWFMFDDEIVVLAAGVGDGAGRAVTTTVDSRIARPTDAITVTGLLRDGRPWPGMVGGSASGTRDTAPGSSGPGVAAAGGGTRAGLAWLRYANASQGTAVGYVFLAGPAPTVSLDTVTRSRRVVRTANPDTPVTRQVFSVTVEQPAGAPPAAFAYALVPNATEQRLRTYRNGPLEVLVNTTRIQAVRHAGLGILAANVFAPGRHDVPVSGRTRGPRLSIDGPASVLIRTEPDGGLAIAVADPTTRRDTVAVTLRGRRLRTVTADPEVRLRRVPGGTRIEVRTWHAYGRSFTATLR